MKESHLIVPLFRARYNSFRNPYLPCGQEICYPKMIIERVVARAGRWYNIQERYFLPCVKMPQASPTFAM
jgi:hypothetical protein